jgi:hypothetical protein
MWLEEGKHYQFEINRRVGVGYDLTLQTISFYEVNTLSDEYLIRFGNTDEDRETIFKRSKQMMLLRVQDRMREMLLKPFIESNPLIYEIYIKPIHPHLSPYPIYPLNTRHTQVSVSPYVPKGQMILVMHPEDYHELEDWSKRDDKEDPSED